MPRILTVANKLLSLRRHIYITDEAGAIAYLARGEFALLSPTWRVFAGEDAEGEPIATIRRKILAWAPTWDITTEAGAFQIKRKVFSWGRQNYALGGKYDGAIIRGNFWDLNFTITHGATMLATATGKILSLRDCHTVEIAGEGEWFVVIAMLVLQLERREAASQSDD